MTNRKAHPLNDPPAMRAIGLIRRWLPRVIADGNDLEACGQVQVAACLAGAAIAVNGCAVAHGLGHALGTVGHVHHGRAVGLSLRVALAGNVAATPERHALVAAACDTPENRPMFEVACRDFDRAEVERLCRGLLTAV